MAKASSINKNVKRRKLAQKFYAKRKQLKDEIYNKDLSLEDRFVLMMKLAQMPRNSAADRVRNRCEITGRPRGFVGRFALSRNMVRDLAGKGCLPGVVKASW
jgi:small subunit ribosomal protein S14